MKAWLSEPSLYMVYSFDLLNVHVRVKIKQRKPHNFQFLFYYFNLFHIVLCTAADSDWAFVEHLILARPCDQLSYTFYGSIHNNQQWSEMNLFCLLYLFHFHSRRRGSGFEGFPPPSTIATFVNPNCYCLCSLSALLLPYTLGFVLATHTFIKSKCAFIFCFPPDSPFRRLLIMDSDLPKRDSI